MSTEQPRFLPSRNPERLNARRLALLTAARGMLDELSEADGAGVALEPGDRLGVEVLIDPIVPPAVSITRVTEAAVRHLVVVVVVPDPSAN